MRIIKILLCLFMLNGISKMTIAARYWVAVSASNWNNTANWSNVSGGPGGFSVPGTSDDVNFDNLGTGNCTVDINLNLKSITVAPGYTGNISQGSYNIATINAVSFGGGVFTGGSGNITVPGTFTLSGGNFTASSGVLELKSNAAFLGGAFLHNNGSTRLNATAAATVSGISPAFYNLEFVGNGNNYTLSSTGNIIVNNNLSTAGTLLYNITGGSIDVKGDINSANTAIGCGGDAVITINGTGVQNFNGSTIAGAGALPQLVINKSAGSLHLANYPAVSNNFSFLTGVVNPGTSTFCFTHGTAASYTINGTLAFANITFHINTSLLTVTIANTLTSAGVLRLSGAGNLVMNGGNIDAWGNIILANTGNGGGGSTTINISGTGNQTMDGTAVAVNQTRLPVLNINKSTGTLFLQGNISFSANVLYTAGNIDAGVSTCYLVNNLTITGSFAVYNLSILPAGNTTITISPGSVLTAMNLLDLENGSNYININSGTIVVQGDLINNNTSGAGGGTGVILFNGSGNQTITSSGVMGQGRLPGITINKPSGMLTFPSLITVRNNWTYISGTLDVITNNATVVFENTLSITGSHTLNNVIFNGSSNFSFTTTAGSTLGVSGTMQLIGTANVVLNSGNINLYGDLLLNNTSVGGGGTTVISFVSPGNQSVISSLPLNQSSLPAVTINKPSGVLTFPALITVKGNWTYVAGVYDVTSNNTTVVFASPLGTGIFGITGTHSLNNVTFEGNNNNTASINTGTVLTVTGTLSTIGNANVFINTPVTGTTAIIALGDFLVNNSSSAGGGNGLILIAGTGAQAFTSTVTAGQGALPYVKIQKPSGVLTMTGIFTETRDWTYVSGTVDAVSNTSTVMFASTNLILTSAGMNFHHLTVNSNTTTLGSNLAVDGNLTINGTGILSPGANSIVLKGHWTNRNTAGFTEGTSTVQFSGSTLQAITCPGGDNFTNFVVNNTGAGIQLSNAVTIATNLTMTNGNIDLNGSTLILGLSAANKGVLTRLNGAMINGGSFTRWFNTAAVADGSVAGLFPVGTATDYRPFFVSAPVTAPVTGGTISVTYTNATSNSPVSFVDGLFTVVLRKDLSWNVASANGFTGGLYNLRVEGTGFGSIGNVNDLRLVLANNILGLAGLNGGTIINPQVNRTGLLLSGITNTFYVGSVNAVNTTLPVKLLSFTAIATGGVIQLDWATSAEIDNDHFTVQRSADAINWEDVRNIKGQGNTHLTTYYTATDQHPKQGKSYYRLLQVEINGNTWYSPPKMIHLTEATGVRIYANPASRLVLISWANAQKMDISAYNNNGQKVLVDMFNTASSATLDFSHVPPGIYVIHVSQGAVVEAKRIIIQ